ncbi:MAG: hypothetical protein EOO60_02485 [Hymenobacter sp.]|nr:MAG: hypothetical protein EOO60_02485 [Hymenobacter sp.]
MENNVLAIYQRVAQTIVASVQEEWTKAYMLIKKQDGHISNIGSGRYTDSSMYLKPFVIRDDELVFELADLLDDLHVITTAGGNNRWNFLWFALLPSGAYEIDFIWNQDEEDKITHLSQTQSLSRPARSADLRAFTQAQAAHRSPLVYELLVRETVKLIPEAWTIARVSLREVGLGIIEHHAAYQSLGEPAEDALTITDSWPALLAVEELRRLKTESGHPDWQQVSFQIEVTGTYRATFTTKPAAENASPTGYTAEGQWLAADAATPLTT